MPSPFDVPVADEVLAGARRGDRGAQGRLYQAFEHAVYNLARRMVGDPDAAKDVTQDAFMKAFGRLHQESYVKWEGTRGALKAKLGLLLDYPRGEPDTLELCTLDAEGRAGPWQPVPVGGNWYPHAFIGPMAGLQRFAAGETTELPTRVDDAIRTMAVVEAAYQSSAHGTTPIPSA